MTRVQQVEHAVTALREARETASSLSEPASMTFRIHEDNGGSYHWTLIAADSATLARSEGFASYDDAEHAAQRVRDAAASARFERRATEATPVDLIARRDAKSADADAERWLDEGGSFSSEAVTQWPAER